MVAKLDPTPHLPEPKVDSPPYANEIGLLEEHKHVNAIPSALSSASFGSEVLPLAVNADMSNDCFTQVEQPFEGYHPSTTWLADSRTNPLSLPDPPYDSPFCPNTAITGSMPADIEFHFQTLSTIFADTNETQLLADFPHISLYSSPIPLPPRDATFSALTNFFSFFEHIMPIYDEATTFQLIELQYDTSPSTNPSLLAYVYSVVALSYACNVHAASVTLDEDEQIAWKYFGHAAHHIPQLMASKSSLLSIQAFLGMVSAGYLLS